MPATTIVFAEKYVYGFFFPQPKMVNPLPVVRVLKCYNLPGTRKKMRHAVSDRGIGGGRRNKKKDGC